MHLLQLLKPVRPEKNAEQRQAVIALSARADAANKLVSVVEIAKRELGEACFQYTGAWGRMEQLKDTMIQMPPMLARLSRRRETTKMQRV